VVFSADLPPHAESELPDRISRMLREQGRTSDAIGRLGDEEFAVIAPWTEASGVLLLVERLERALTAIEGNGGRELALRAGYCAVPDYTTSKVDAVEMLLRATSTLRQLRADSSLDRIRAYEATIPVNAP
jgi:GGDEF domain-containing protein